MSKYIGATVVNLSVDTVDVTGDITATDSTPELILLNDTHEDTDGGREGKITFKGEQSGGEVTVLAQIQSGHDGTSDDEKGELIFKTNDGNDGSSPSEAMRINSLGNVGIGTDTIDVSTQAGGSGYQALQIESDEGGQLNFDHNDAGTGSTLGQINFQRAGEVVAEIEGVTDGATDNGRIAFRVQPDGGALTEAMRIDHDGSLFVGTTNGNPTGNHEPGMLVSASGQINIHRDSANPLRVGRSNSGNLMELYVQGTLNAQIGLQSTDNLYLGGSISNHGGLLFGTNTILPFNVATQAGVDDAFDLGQSVNRFDDIYATNGTIQTSDENEKQNIASLTSAEITAATALSKLFKTFKWKSKVTAKGNDARTHTGVIAQQVQSAMSDAGLDASKYAFWCSNTWWEKDVEVAAVEADEEKGIEAKDAYTRTDTYETKDEAPEGATERTRMGIRYPELLAFIGAATEQRLTSIESRLTALEGE
jgi:hypothetical protein